MNITPQAQAQIARICDSQHHFRIQVQAGGCSGFAHEFEITDQVHADSDVLVGSVCMDTETASILSHAVLDWKSDLSGSQFVLTIPEATSQCGCGKSFSLF